MNKKLIMASALLLCLGWGAVASEPANPGRKSAIKEEIKAHYKLYGFVRNYFAYDSRVSTAGPGDLFYYLPKDNNWNMSETEAASARTERQDLNAVSSFRFLSLTSRLGVDVVGYRIGNMDITAKIETDFYSGLSSKAGDAFPAATGMSGTAQLRLRQAYMTLGWKDLPMCGENKASVNLKMGQAWHPLTADQPAVFSLETGAPFNPFSRTPQVTMDANLGSHWMLTGSLIWQMQYLSVGPNGASADYMKYGCTPEFYAGVTFKTGGLLMRAGATTLSIKPRGIGVNNEGYTVKVSDRITTVTPYFYFQYTHKTLQLKAKTVYGSAGEHMNIMSGYGVTDSSATDGHWEYAPLHTSSTWASISYGKKWQGMLMAGYIKNLGSNKDLEQYWISDKSSKNLVSMWRIVPAVCYNLGKFTLGLEYNITCAKYGTNVNSKGIAQDNLHNVANNRVQMMVKYTF